MVVSSLFPFDETLSLAVLGNLFYTFISLLVVKEGFHLLTRKYKVAWFFSQ